MASKINTKPSVARQLSTAVGLLAFAAFIIQGAGDIFGFEAVAKQFSAFALLVGGGINVYFLGVTNQKNTVEKQEGESDAKSTE